MKNIRLIARLDIKAPNLIKGINLEGVRVVGDPQSFAENYYQQGVDEILYMDAVATLYERNNLTELVSKAADKVFVPMSVGGGIRSLQDVDNMLRCGADKVALNTQAIKTPEIISQIAKRFGSQCVVLSVEAKQIQPGEWEAYTDNGRNKTGLDVIDWVKKAEDLGIGELLVTSVDREGMCAGFDVELMKAVTSAVNVPVIASGGMGTKEHLLEIVTQGNVDAVAIAHVLHYNKINLFVLKDYLVEHGFTIREVAHEYSSCY